MKKKNAIMLADTRTALVGTVLLQLQKTNPGLFDEALIYYEKPIPEKDRDLMSKIMPCRFISYVPAIPPDVMEKPRFKRFSKLMFCRYEMFSFLGEFETVTWLDTDILIQGDLSLLIESAKKTGAVMIREDPANKTAENPDYMRTCFTRDVPEYQMEQYLYCSGTIVLSKKVSVAERCTQWCYEKTIQWADILSLPDQGVLNAAIQEFDIDVTPISGKVYCCYPYMGRDCSKARIIHSWGSNKFWNDWYVYLHFPAWNKYYRQWCASGGTELPFEIQPKISVLIPSYKPNIPWMKECLDSLMNQNRAGWERFSDFEIIIVAEPFETEGIQKLVESYRDLRIRLVINKSRLGIAASLNRGMRLARGKYIARVDDDDYCAPERLFTQMEYLEEHPEISLCTSDFEYFGDMNEWRLSFEGDMSFAWSIFTCPFDHPTVMFRKDFFIRNDLFYDEDRGFVEDWELWNRAFEKGMRVGSIHKVLFYHRWINSGSAGQTGKTVDMMRELVRKNFQQLDVCIPEEDLPLIAPWNGRLVNEADIQKLEGYFACALEANRRKRIYDQASLERAFQLRAGEARTGQLQDLRKPVQRQSGQVEESSGDNALPVYSKKKPHFLRRLLKRILKPLYRPFRRRYEDRLIEIQSGSWRNEGHLLNCIEKLDRIVLGQQEQIRQLQDSLASLRLETQAAISAKIYEQAENTRQELSARLFAEAENTRARVLQLSNRVGTVGDHVYDIGQELRFQHNLMLSEQSGKAKLFLIGTPEHSNIGDAAITLGESAFLHKYFHGRNIVELSTYDFDSWYGRIAGMIEAGDLIFLQGGGNLGNRFLQEEKVRRRVIADFVNNKIVIMPQTVYFDDNASGQRELELSREIYSRHKHLTIFTRGLQSKLFAERNFANARIVNSLDMALMLDYDFKLPRKGALLCLRDLDDESGLDAASYAGIVSIVEKRFAECVRTNNLYKGDRSGNILRDMRREIVTAELEKFAASRVVVTDRLHGLIFSIITHTPCVVISAFNQKLAEFCEFFADSNAVFFIDKNLDLLSESIEKAMQVADADYPVLRSGCFDKVYYAIQET